MSIYGKPKNRYVVIKSNNCRTYGKFTDVLNKNKEIKKQNNRWLHQKITLKKPECDGILWIIILFCTHLISYWTIALVCLYNVNKCLRYDLDVTMTSSSPSCTFKLLLSCLHLWEIFSVCNHRRGFYNFSSDTELINETNSTTCPYQIGFDRDQTFQFHDTCWPFFFNSQRLPFENPDVSFYLSRQPYNPVQNFRISTWLFIWDFKHQDISCKQLFFSSVQQISH